jgi:hypothetical protein
LREGSQTLLFDVQGMSIKLDLFLIKVTALIKEFEDAQSRI